MPLATLSIDLEARLAGLEAGLDKASQIAKQNAEKIQKQFDGLKSVGAGLASSLAAAFSVSAITLFVRTTIDGVDALNDLKDATGASTGADQVQRGAERGQAEQRSRAGSQGDRLERAGAASA